MFENITVKNLKYFIEKLSNSGMLYDALKYDFQHHGTYFEKNINFLLELKILSISDNRVNLKSNISNNNFSAELIKILSKDQSEYGESFQEYIKKFQLTSGKYSYTEKTSKYSSIRNLLYSLGIIKKEESEKYYIDELYLPYILNIIDLSISSTSNETLEKKIEQHINNERTIISTDVAFINNLKKEREYTCEACGFIFKDIYEDSNKSNKYIEAHHLKTKESAKKELKTGEVRVIKKEDFAILCANCHRMIHQIMSSDSIETISLYNFKKRISKEYISMIKKLTQKQ